MYKIFNICINSYSSTYCKCLVELSWILLLYNLPTVHALNASDIKFSVIFTIQKQLESRGFEGYTLQEVINKIKKLRQTSMKKKKTKQGDLKMVHANSGNFFATRHNVLAGDD